MTGETDSQIQAKALLDAFSTRLSGHYRYWELQAAALPEGQAILDAAPMVQVAVLRIALNRPRPTWWPVQYDLLARLCRRRLPYSVTDVDALLDAMSRLDYPYTFPTHAMLRALSRPLADPDTLAACQPKLEQLRRAVDGWSWTEDPRRFRHLLDAIVGTPGRDPVVIHPDEWGSQVLPMLGRMDAAERERWDALLYHCAVVSGTRPTRRWLLSACASMDAVGCERSAALAAEWVGAFAKSSYELPTYDLPGQKTISHGCLLIKENAVLLKGLAWASACADDPRLAAALGEAALAGYRRIQGIGPRSAMVATACTYALATMGSAEAHAQLNRVQAEVMQPRYRAYAVKVEAEVARRVGSTQITNCLPTQV